MAHVIPLRGPAGALPALGAPRWLANVVEDLREVLAGLCVAPFEAGLRRDAVADALDQLGPTVLRDIGR